MSQFLKIDAEVLAEEVAWIAKSGGKSGLPVLRSVEVTAVVGALCLRRTDYELWRESVIPASGGGQAKVLVDPVKLGSLLKGTAGNAVLAVADTELRVSTNGRSVKLRSSAAADDFPEWPTFKATGKPAIVSARQVARALTSVGTDDTMEQLTVVKFEDGAMASTDRFRLSVITYADKGFTTVVPGAALRAFAAGDGVVSIEHGKLARKLAGAEPVEGGMVRVSSGGRSIIVRVPDVEFPKWRNLIQPDDEYTVHAILRRAELLEAIGDGDVVTVTLRDDDTMRITSSDRDGDVEVTQDITASLLKGDELPFTARYTAGYLAGIVKSIDDGMIQFFASSPLKPVVLKGSTDDEMHLLMPVRMPS